MEILNIEYHTARIAVKALNQTKTFKEAAALLGITDRHLHNLKGRYNIRRNEQGLYEQNTANWVIVNIPLRAN